MCNARQNYLKKRQLCRVFINFPSCHNSHRRESTEIWICFRWIHSLGSFLNSRQRKNATSACNSAPFTIANAHNYYISSSRHAASLSQYMEHWQSFISAACEAGPIVWTLPAVHSYWGKKLKACRTHSHISTSATKSNHWPWLVQCNGPAFVRPTERKEHIHNANRVERWIWLARMAFAGAARRRLRWVLTCAVDGSDTTGEYRLEWRRAIIKTCVTDSAMMQLLWLRVRIVRSKARLPSNIVIGPCTNLQAANDARAHAVDADPGRRRSGELINYTGQQRVGSRYNNSRCLPRRIRRRHATPRTGSRRHHSHLTAMYVHSSPASTQRSDNACMPAPHTWESAVPEGAASVGNYARCWKSRAYRCNYA